MKEIPPQLQEWLRRGELRSCQRDAEAVAIRSRLSAAVRILVEVYGVSEVVLFGSLADGNFHEGSDVDLAVRGLPAPAYFFALAQVADVLGRNVDLVEIDSARPSLQARIAQCGEWLHGPSSC